LFHFKRDATLRRYDGRRWAPHLDGEPDGALHPLPVSLLTVMDPPIISQKRRVMVSPRPVPRQTTGQHVTVHRVVVNDEQPAL